MIIQAREQRIKQYKISKIYKLIIVLLVLIMLIPIQTIIWLLSNPPEQPKWFSQTVNYKVNFKSKE